MERKATITIERTSGDVTGKCAEGYVIVREDGTLADRINDADADLGDVYDSVELAMSGETLGPEGLFDEVEVDGVTYSWEVRPLPPTVRYAICALDLDPNDGSNYDLNAVADEFARCLRARIESEWTGAGELATIRIERHQIGGSSQGGQYVDGTEVEEYALDAIKRAAFEAIDWATCEVDDIESILDELRAARDEDRDADVDEDAAFRAVYGRDPDADDRKDDIWSLIYAGLDA